MPAPCCPPPGPPQPLPTTGPDSAHKPECPLSARFPRDGARTWAGVAGGRAALGESRRQQLVSISPPLGRRHSMEQPSWSEVKQPQKRVGPAAVQVSQPSRPRPSARLPHRQGHSEGGCDSGPGGQSDRRTLSPRSRRRWRQVGLPWASPARPGGEAARPCHPPPAGGVVLSRPVPHLGNRVHQAPPRPAGWSEDDIRFGKCLPRGGHRARPGHSAQGSPGEDGRSPDLWEEAEAGLKPFL